MIKVTYDELLDVLNYTAQDGMADEPILKALRAVVELHKPTENGKSCTYCYNNCHSRSGIMCEDYCRTHDAYPCFTIQAIEKELG